MTTRRAGIILINNEDNILLVKGRRTKKWGFPKGSIEEGESVKECAIREFNEETGLNFEGDEVCDGMFIDMGCEYFIIRLQVSDLNKVSEIDTAEVTDVKWFPERQLKGLEKNTSLRVYYEKFIQPKYKKPKKAICSTSEDGWTTVHIGVIPEIFIDPITTSVRNVFSHLSENI